MWVTPPICLGVWYANPSSPCTMCIYFRGLGVFQPTSHHRSGGEHSTRLTIVYCVLYWAGRVSHGCIVHGILMALQN